MMIPARVEDLTPEWFSEILDRPVRSVDILDAHSGTTGRARVGLTVSSDLPDTVFVKLQPFVAEQRKFLRQIGLGVAEARLYANVGAELPVRAPRVWHADYDESEGAFVMVLEDLQACGCRFPSPSDDDMLDVAASMMDELAMLHATYRGQELSWLRTPSGMKRKPEDSETAGVRDVAYFLCNSLPVATRRAEERALLDRYRAALSKRGRWLQWSARRRPSRTSMPSGCSRSVLVPGDEGPFSARTAPASSAPRGAAPGHRRAVRRRPSRPIPSV